jgi:hypothetical protein
VTVAVTQSLVSDEPHSTHYAKATRSVAFNLVSTTNLVSSLPFVILFKMGGFHEKILHRRRQNLAVAAALRQSTEKLRNAHVAIVIAENNTLKLTQ